MAGTAALEHPYTQPARARPGSVAQTFPLWSVGRRPKDELLELCWVQMWACWYCHRTMLPEHLEGDNRSPTLEHRSPIARGGAKTGSNVVAACERCNSLKGHNTESGFVTSKVFRAALGKPKGWVWKRPRLMFD